MGILAWAAFLVFFSASSFVFAQTAPDPALDARVRALSSELRCLVCQNQTVADSDSGVARDIRDQVRTQLAAGKSESEVKTYMTDRFGDFVLYNPPNCAALSARTRPWPIVIRVWHATCAIRCAHNSRPARAKPR